MKTLIAIPVYNRLRVAELCLQSVYQNRGDSVVQIYDDHSTEFSSDVLAPYCDELIKLPPSNRPVVKMQSNTKGMGVQHLRWHQFRRFLKQPEFDFLYFTDCDAFHDPTYMEVLKFLAEFLKKTERMFPVCLYNSTFHGAPANCLGSIGRLLVRATAPGISHLYSREMVETIVHRLDALQADPDYGWDYIAPRLLGLPFITTQDSFIEHFGAVPGSMHTQAGDWDRDRAINPTQHLAGLRDHLIAYLDGAKSYAAAV